MGRLQGGEKQGKVSKLMKNEVLMLNIGSMCTGARVIAVRHDQPALHLPAIFSRAHLCPEIRTEVTLLWATLLQVKHDLAKLQLTSPVCTKEQEKIALSRRVEKHWRLIGWGQIQKGQKMDLPKRV